MGKQQCAAGLHERPHAIGTGVAPAVASDEDGIADPRIEERFPGRVTRHVGSHQIGQRSGGGEIAADRDRIATGGGGDHRLRDPGIKAEESEFHKDIVSRRPASDQPGPVQQGPA